MFMPFVAIPGLLLPLPPAASAELVQPSEDLYPSFPLGPELLVVNVSTKLLPPGEILALTTLEGLVNRKEVRLYLDPGDQWDNTSSVLTFLGQHYGIPAYRITADEALHRFAGEAKGIVIYEPTRPATINVATTYAGVNDLIAADPGVASILAAEFGLPVALDLRRPPWADLRDDASLVRFELQELYPVVDHHRLIILRPDHFGLRDYAVATRSFVFYMPQGPIASPWSVSVTEEVLAHFPQGIPILGWFQTLSRAEENFFVQRSSRYGKVILGGEDLMDLTVLTSMGRGKTYHLASEPSALPLEDRIYIAFSVPDGDNLDFLIGRMAKLWNNGGRGRLPLAWSLNPLLGELAPPLIDYYATGRTANDSFVAGPSGAGYLYPGFTPAAALAAHLQRTARAMEATGMREVWLLNSFTTYEPPYPTEVLQAYVAALGPRGLLLDYGDMASTRDYWMEEGGGRAAAVVRTTHMWGTAANFQGKVDAEVDALGPGPHFIFAAIYPWSFSPGDALRAIDTLRSRYGDRVVPVSTADLIDLMERNFLTQARAQAHDVMPFGSAFGSGASAKSYVDRADAAAASGDVPGAGYYGYQALEAGQAGIALVYSAALVVVFAVALIVVLSLPRRSHPGYKPPWSAAAFALATLGLLLGTREVLWGNFWDYYPLGLGLVAAGLALGATKGVRSTATRVVGGVMEAVSLAVLPLTPIAFVPLTAGSTLVLAAHLRRNPTLAPDLILGGFVGVWASLLMPIPYPVAPVALLVGLAALAPFGSPALGPRAPLTVARRGLLLTAIAALAALPVALLPLQALHSFFLRLGPLSQTAVALDLLLPGMALALALALVRVRGSLTPRGLGSTTVALPMVSIAVYFSPGGLVAAIASLALLTLLIFLPLSLALRLPAWGHPPAASLALRWPAFAMLAALLATLPGITYSLYLLPLPTSAEYVLYSTPLLLAVVVALVGVILVISLRDNRRGLWR